MKDKQIDFSSSLSLTQELAKYAEINGFFDVIKETFLAILVMDNSIKIVVGNIQTKLDEVSVYYKIENGNRVFKINFPENMCVDFMYTSKDLVADPMLLLGSYEEIEDYDFGCYIYNIKNSQERQLLIFENWGKTTF